MLFDKENHITSVLLSLSFACTGERILIVNFCFSAKSIIEATQYMLGQGAQYVLTHRFCQDPVEELFGRHRMMGRRATNMNLQTFG